MSPNRMSQVVLLFLMPAILACRIAKGETPTAVRETLANGMRVVLIQSHLAPVVTVEMSVLAGGSESPAQFPGMAHAEEHMAFRGCDGMTGPQTSALYAQLGDEDNAETQQNATQFYSTVPASDLDLALEAQARCLSNIENTEVDWRQERRSLLEEVRSNRSDPSYLAERHIQQTLFAGTPYAKDPLGSEQTYSHTTAEMLKGFFRSWYGPSNVVLVIVGDLDTETTLRRVRELFGAIAPRAAPRRSVVILRPVVPKRFTVRSGLPFNMSLFAYRLPGTDSPAYAATILAADVLASERGPLRSMVSNGVAMQADFELQDTSRAASVGLATLAVSSDSQGVVAVRTLRKTLETYVRDGVPEELVEAAKKHEWMRAMADAGSIPALADRWSDAVALEGRASPDQDLQGVLDVTAVEVTTVIRRYLCADNRAIVWIKSGRHSPRPVSEVSAIERPVKDLAPVATQLPDWAQGRIKLPGLDEREIVTADMRLPNGIRLIVRTDRTTPVVKLTGSVQHNEFLDTPRAREGISEVLEHVFSCGTYSRSRAVFLRDLDAIGADEQAGYQFSLAVPESDFRRGVELLAENELHPALTEANFKMARQQTKQWAVLDQYDQESLSKSSLDRALLPANDPELREVTPRTLAALTLDQVRSYYNRTFRPDLTTIVVVGNISPDEARAVIERSFGAWEHRDPAPQTTLPPVPSNRAASMTIMDRSRQQDTVILSEQLEVLRSDPQYYPLRLGTEILAGGFYAGRLYRDLRETAGYVYRVDVDFTVSAHRANYTISFDCRPGNVHAVRSIIAHDLDQMRNEVVPASELYQAKSLILRQAILSQMSEDLMADGLLERAESGIPLDEPYRSAKIYTGLTAEDIKDAFAQKVHVDHLVQIVIGPEPLKLNSSKRR